MQFTLCKPLFVLPCQAMAAGKPKHCLTAGESGLKTKILRVMKITAFFLFVACLHVQGAGYAQGITISKKDAAISEIFREIRKQTGYQFLFRDQDVEKAKRVSIYTKNASLEEVLDKCFEGQPLEYTIEDRTVIVRRKIDSPAPASFLPTTTPPVDVTGTVIDKDGKPLAGANVKVKGTNLGTTTNKDGIFTLINLHENAVLEISYVGYEQQIVNVRGQRVLVINLTQKLSMLDETVVIAYGTTTQRLNTGNVVTVKASEVEKNPVNNPLLALQGRVPGMFITQASGLPGTALTVRIQGQNSLSQGNDPLYVIDGVPYIGLLSPTANPILTPNGSGGTTGSPLNFINPSDIESIEVLKDADATAIYGSRAANGAVLITTKKGKVGPTRINVNLQNGWGKVTRMLPLLNTEQYLEMRKEAFSNDGVSPGVNDFDVNGTWDSTRYTDWQKELIGGTANFKNAQLSISGGSVNTSFSLGAGYHSETSVFPGDISDQKTSFHFNINHTSSNQKFKIQFLGNYMFDKNNLISYDYTSMSVNIPPNAPALYNSDGTLNWETQSNGNSTWHNPLSFLDNTYRNKTRNLIANVSLGYEVLRGVEIKSTFGYTNLYSDELIKSPLSAYAPENRINNERASDFGNNLIETINIEPQLVFKRNVNKGAMEVLFGTTFLRTISKGEQIYASGFNNDLVMEDIKSASSIFVNQSIASDYKYNAVFGRLNYNWLNKYIINVTARRDGSSRFGSNNLFNNFASVGMAWIFSNEAIIKNELSFISFGKFRFSFGTTGNDQIGNYKFMNLYNPFAVQSPYQGAIGLTPNGLPNPYLQWEETKKMQFGVDLGLFADRILMNVNYYRNRSSNQLTAVQLPYITGFPSIQDNLAALIQNTGLEISMNILALSTKKLTWNSSINLTLPNNKLLRYPNFENSTLVSSYAIGYPLTIRKVYQNIGIDPSTGLYQFVDRNGNISSSLNFSLDRTRIMDIGPKVYGGFQNSINYNGLELSVLFYFSKQTANSNYLLGSQPGYFFSSPGSFNYSALGNQPIWVFDRWQKTGDQKTQQKFSARYPTTVYIPYLNATRSQIVTTDASFIRLKNISLSWQIPTNWKKALNLHDAKIYMHGQNLFTITSYKGMDPENQSVRSLPPLKVLTFGIQLIL